MKNSKLFAGCLALGISSSLVSSHAKAYDGAGYLGIDGGVSWTNLNDSGVASQAFNDLIESQTRISSSSSSRTTNFSGRLYAGYMFMDYLGFEVGYARYGESTGSTSVNVNRSKISINSSDRISAFDLLGVYRLPVNDGVSINVKAGFAYVINEYEVKTQVDGGVQNKEGSQKNTNIRPKFGIGAEFRVADDLNIGASYEITVGNNQPYSISGRRENFSATGNSNYSPLIQMLSVGLRYDF